MVVNRSLIQFYGIRRSGNHAVVRWIADHVGGPCVHLDDIDPRASDDPYRAFARINMRGLPFWKCKPKLPSFIKYLWRRPQEVTFTRSDPWLRIDFIREYAVKGLLLLSYEDERIALCNGVEKYVGQSAACKTVVLLRDAPNLFASLVKSRRLTPDTQRALVECYKDYCRFWLSRDGEDDSEVVLIKYDEWFLSRDCRMRLARELGFRTTGDPLKAIPYQGGGSSFDGTTMAGQGDSMKTLTRWKDMAGNELLESILADSEVADLTRAVFGSTIPSPYS